MALQSSGPIKWSEIVEEFGDPIATNNDVYYNVPWIKWTPQVPWVKSSDGQDGWYNSGVSGAWSQFMVDQAVYPTNTNPEVGNHTATWRISGVGLDSGDYTLECQADSSATFKWDGTFIGGTQSESAHNTSELITIENVDFSTEHYLTTTVTNTEWVPQEGLLGIEFTPEGDLKVTGSGTKQIRIWFGFSDNQGDEGVALGQYIIQDLGVEFLQGVVDYPIWDGGDPEDSGAPTTDPYPYGRFSSLMDGESNTFPSNSEPNLYWNNKYPINTAPFYSKGSTFPRSLVVTVEGGKTYTCIKRKPQDIKTTKLVDNKIVLEDDKPINMRSIGYENTRDVDDWTFRSNKNQRLCFKDNDSTDANSAIWISEVDEDIPDTSVSATGWYGLDDNPDSGVSSNPVYDSTIPTLLNMDGNDWKVNPGGVAWELKNSSGEVIRRSSDSFNYDHASSAWGSFLNTYAVYPSKTEPLTDVWHESNYIFNTNSSSTYDFEAVADSKFEIYLYDTATTIETLWMNSEGNESCDIGSCNSITGATLDTNSTYRLRVRVYNASSTTLPTNLWFHNPGGFGFTIKDSSGTVIKSSLDTGNQGFISEADVNAGLGARFGNYRVSEVLGTLTGIPLDTNAGVDENVDIPKEGPISFSNFYNARLNMAIDYFNGDTEYEPESARLRYNNSDKVQVIGGFKGRISPEGGSSKTAGKKVLIVVDKTLGGKPSSDSVDLNSCTLKTGSSWDTDTKMDVLVGSVGKIYGTGGRGGNGNRGKYAAGHAGASGLSGLGIEFNAVGKTLVEVRTGGLIRGGGGGGGGGAGAWGDHNEFGKDESTNSSGGGGGGGAGLPFGEGGSNGGGNSADGEDGSLTEGGEGGVGEETSAESQEVWGGSGGVGGDAAQNGGDGSNGYCDNDGECRPGNGGEGGAAGAAIRRSDVAIDFITSGSGSIEGSTDAIGVA